MIDKLATPGGGIAVLLCLCLGSLIAMAFKVPNADQVLLGSFTALLAMLRGGNGQQQEKPK